MTKFKHIRCIRRASFMFPGEFYWAAYVPGKGWCNLTDAWRLRLV